MKQLFHIVNGAEHANGQLLSLKIGEQHCCFAVTDKNGQQLVELASYSFEPGDTIIINQLKSAHPVINQSFDQVLIGYEYPQSTLVANSQYNESGADGLLQTLFGITSNNTILTEKIPAWQLHNVYAVPQAIRESVRQHYPACTESHSYSLAIKKSNPSVEGGEMQVDFRKEDFTVIVSANGKLLLAQTFIYSTPEDVLYYLLKCCQQFHLSQQDVRLVLSGLIDQQSALFKDLYQYFIHVNFRDVSWSGDTSDYPAHFFTTLNDLAQCVS